MNSILNISETVTFEFDKDTLLDDVFFPYIKNDADHKLFVEFLSNPPSEKEAVVERQSLFEYFYINRQVLRLVFNNFQKGIEIKQEYDDFKRRNRGLSEKNEVRNACMISISLIQCAAKSIRQMLFLLSRSDEAIGENETLPDTLKVLSSELRKICRNESSDELKALLTEFENLSFENSVCKINAYFDKAGKAYKSTLISVDEQNYNHKNDQGTRKFLNKIIRQNNGETIYEGMNSGVPNDCVELLLNALNSILKVLENIINTIHSHIKPLIKDFKIIEICCRYIESLSSLGVKTYPSITDENISFTGLYDYALLCKRKSTELVVPNDFMLDNGISGIIISGDNATGKTTYLRSIATAIIFARSGLPVSAENGTVSMVTGLFAISAGEEVHKDNAINPFGRFESEAQMLADIIFNAQKGSVVFVNEIFQSTSYSDGAKALCDIIKYLIRKGVKPIIVTHLKELFFVNFGYEISHVNPDNDVKYRFAIN